MKIVFANALVIITMIANLYFSELYFFLKSDYNSRVDEIGFDIHYLITPPSDTGIKFLFNN